MEEKDIKKIEKIVGYTFKDKSLLERALTHGSASKNALENYQSLEFLGDSILDFIAAKRPMEINPNAHEGALTRIRASIVSKEPLAEEVKKLGLEKYLIVGKGENLAYISSQEKIMSDLFESMIAAIYLDSKSIDVAEQFILSKLADLFNGKCTGPAHNPNFVVEVKINTFTAGVGKGKTKREAEQNAAKVALDGILKK